MASLAPPGMPYENPNATVAATPTPASSQNGRRQSAPPSTPPSSVPARVPAPCDRPNRLITRPRRRGEIRSLTTEYPTEPTAPSPRLASICAPKKSSRLPEGAVATSPAAHSSEPSRSSRFRLGRSPQYGQPARPTAPARQLAAATHPLALAATG